MGVPGGQPSKTAGYWRLPRRVAIGVVPCVAAIVLLAMAAAPSVPRGRQHLGPYGPEGARLREQLWIVPGGAPGVSLRATVFRPDDPPSSPRPTGGIAALFSSSQPMRRPLVVINHGTDESNREAVAMPVFYWLSRWFVDRGYVVVLPQRRGHGATGGELAEARDHCANPDHTRAGNTAANDVAAVVRFMREQPFVQRDTIVVAGISTGGWASLALAARNPPGVAAIVNFAGGRGARAYGRPNAICGEAELVQAAAAFGASSRVPTVWLYARNDTFFGPELATDMASAFKGAGGAAELHMLPAHGGEGHGIADDRSGWKLWGAQLERFLALHAGLPGREMAARQAQAQAR